jgi:hypothetical protein
LENEVMRMERRNFWNVQIEQLRDCTVKAGLVRSGRYERYPKDTYGADAGREVWSVWFDSEAAAREAVAEALAMNENQEAAA